jgi:hypothetical protein
LVDRCLVRGGVASESAVQLLIASILDRLRIKEPGLVVVPEQHSRPADAAFRARRNSSRSITRKAG